MKAPTSSREDRLAAALRENLKRRKARTRALKPQPEEPAEKTAPPAEPRPKSAKNRA